MSGASRLSPLRCGVWVLCVRAWTVRVSDGLVRLISFVFSLLGGKKTLFVYPFCSFFGLPLTATIVPISLDASPFHQIGWAEPYWKKRSCGLDC